MLFATMPSWVSYWLQALPWAISATWAIAVDTPWATALFVAVTYLLIAAVRGPGGLVARIKDLAPNLKWMSVMAFCVFMWQLFVAAPVHFFTKQEAKISELEETNTSSSAKISQLESEKTKLESDAGSLRRISDDRQNTINELANRPPVTVGRSVTPSVALIRTAVLKQTKYPDLIAVRYLLLPNTTMEGFAFKLSVDQRIEDVEVNALGAGGQLRSNPQFSDDRRSFVVRFEMPTIRATTPIEVVVYSTEPINGERLEHGAERN